MDERSARDGTTLSPADLRRVRVGALGILLGLALVALVMPLVMTRIGAPQPTPIMLYTQDIVLLPVFCIAVLLFGPGKPVAWEPRVSRRGLAFAAALLFAVCVWGHWSVFQGIDLSRDEQMAVFDAAIFRKGALTAPIPPDWRGIAPALNLLFILPLGDHAAWVSAYLPGNAALRALVSLVADPVIASPLLVVVGLLALAAIARRLWPTSPGSQLAALLCYGCSSQIVVTGMTAFAMTAHLTLNLVWLWLFLRGDRIGFVGTVLVGFLATGVHQPLFHPLFALPFVLDLARQRQWRRFTGYGIAYALIGMVWLAWPVWMSGRFGPVPVANDREGIDFVTRLLRELALVNVGALWTMAANLIRFLTWQHLLLLPLMLLGIGRARRWPLVAPLAVGLVLPIVVMGVILPWQGHGWGYRYLHPVLGNASLLAGYGWQRAEAAGIDLRRSMIGASIASLLLLLPVHGWMTRTMVAAQAVPEHAIARLPADIAVIDTVRYSDNLVSNAPDLSNRPIRLKGSALRPEDIARVCQGRRIAFVDAPQLGDLTLYYDGMRAARATAHQQALRNAAKTAGCTITGG